MRSDAVPFGSGPVKERNRTCTSREQLLLTWTCLVNWGTCCYLPNDKIKIHLCGNCKCKHDKNRYGICFTFKSFPGTICSKQLLRVCLADQASLPPCYFKCLIFRFSICSAVTASVCAIVYFFQDFDNLLMHKANKSNTYIRKQASWKRMVPILKEDWVVFVACPCPCLLIQTLPEDRHR